MIFLLLMSKTEICTNNCNSLRQITSSGSTRDSQPGPHSKNDLVILIQCLLSNAHKLHIQEHLNNKKVNHFRFLILFQPLNLRANLNIIIHNHNNKHNQHYHKYAILSQRAATSLALHDLPSKYVTHISQPLNSINGENNGENKRAFPLTVSLILLTFQKTLNYRVDV